MKLVRTELWIRIQVIFLAVFNSANQITLEQSFDFVILEDTEFTGEL